jgi:hypothetical protein
MGSIKFDIRHPDGKRESSVVEGDRAIVGSGSHCDVRLPIDQAAYEHVVLEVVGSTLRAEAKVDQPPATINEMPLTAGSLDADSVLGIGRIRLYVNFVPDVLDGASGDAARKKGSSNPLVQVALIGVFVAAAYLLLNRTDPKIAPPPAEEPQLFADQAKECPQKTPTQALAFAHEQKDLADSRRERMPFRVTDGVSAVTDYEVAALCFKKANAPNEAKEADLAAKTLRDDLVNDFRARRLRLGHMLKVEDFELARQDVAVLRALTQNRETKYSKWLEQADKKLGAKVKKK